MTRFLHSSEKSYSHIACVLHSYYYVHIFRFDDQGWEVWSLSDLKDVVINDDLLYRLKRYLYKKLSLTAIEIEKDGNCFYRASLVAAGRPDSFAGVKATRLGIASEMQQLLAGGHLDHSVFAGETANESWEQRIAAMPHAGLDNAWGGFEDLLSAVRYFAREIIVYRIQPDGNIPPPVRCGVDDAAVDYVKPGTEPIQLLFNCNHFEALLTPQQLVRMPARVPNTAAEQIEAQVHRSSTSSRSLRALRRAVAKCATKGCVTNVGIDQRHCKEHIEVAKVAAQVHNTLMLLLKMQKDTNKDRSNPIADADGDVSDSEADQVCTLLRTIDIDPQPRPTPTQST